MFMEAASLPVVFIGYALVVLGVAWIIGVSLYLVFNPQTLEDDPLDSSQPAEERKEPLPGYWDEDFKP